MSIHRESGFCPACGKPDDDGAFVTLPKPEYLRLQKSAQSARLPTPGNRYKGLSSSPICLNFELADFIFEYSKSMNVRQIPPLCFEKFGPAGKISYSAVHRFLSRVPKHFYD